MDLNKKITIPDFSGFKKQFIQFNKNLNEYIKATPSLWIFIRIFPTFVVGVIMGGVLTGNLSLLAGFILILLNSLGVAGLVYDLYIFYTKYYKQYMEEEKKKE